MLLIFEEKIPKIRTVNECPTDPGKQLPPRARPRMQQIYPSLRTPNGKASWKPELGQAGAHRPGSAHRDLLRADREGVQAHTRPVHPVNPPPGVGSSQQEFQVHSRSPSGSLG